MRQRRRRVDDARKYADVPEDCTGYDGPATAYTPQAYLARNKYLHRVEARDKHRLLELMTSGLHPELQEAGSSWTPTPLEDRWQKFQPNARGETRGTHPGRWQESMSHLVVALIRHRGMAYLDSSIEFPLLVGLLCVAHKWIYTYQSIMDMLVLGWIVRICLNANTKEIEYRLVKYIVD